MPKVIALTKRRGSVYEEAWEEGTQGATVRKSHIQGDLSPGEVLANARSMIGKSRYDLFSNNCEHFVRWAHGIPVESRQVVGGVTGSVALGLVGLKLFDGHKGVAFGLAVFGGLLGVSLANQRS